MQRITLNNPAMGRREMREAALVAVLALTGLAAMLLLPFYAQAQSESSSFHGSHSGPKVDHEALFESAAPLADSQQGRQLLADCLEAYGGQEKLQNLKGFRLHYSMTPMMSTESFPVIKSFQTGRGYRYVKGDEERILNGTKCWYTKGDQVADMDGGRYRAELFSYLTLAMPLASETEHFDNVRFGKRDDDPLSYLYFDKADSVLVILGINAETNRIMTTAGVIRQDDQRFTFINEFDDYRQVEGFWFPHSMINISMGLKVAESVLDKVEVNPSFAQDAFLPQKTSK